MLGSHIQFLAYAAVEMPARSQQEPSRRSEEVNKKIPVPHEKS